MSTFETGIETSSDDEQSFDAKWERKAQLLYQMGYRIRLEEPNKKAREKCPKYVLYLNGEQIASQYVGYYSPDFVHVLFPRVGLEFVPFTRNAEGSSFEERLMYREERERGQGKPLAHSLVSLTRKKDKEGQVP